VTNKRGRISPIESFKNKPKKLTLSTRKIHEKKFKTLEKERPDEMEMAKKTYEERKET